VDEREDVRLPLYEHALEGALEFAGAALLGVGGVAGERVKQVPTEDVGGGAAGDTEVLPVRPDQREVAVEEDVRVGGVLEEALEVDGNGHPAGEGRGRAKIGPLASGAALAVESCPGGCNLAARAPVKGRGSSPASARCPASSVRSSSSLW